MRLSSLVNRLWGDVAGNWHVLLPLAVVVVLVLLQAARQSVADVRGARGWVQARRPVMVAWAVGLWLAVLGVRPAAAVERPARAAGQPVEPADVDPMSPSVAGPDAAWLDLDALGYAVAPFDEGDLAALAAGGTFGPLGAGRLPHREPQHVIPAAERDEGGTDLFDGLSAAQLREAEVDVVTRFTRECRRAAEGR